MRDALSSSLADTAMLLGVAVLAVSAVAEAVEGADATGWSMCGWDVDVAPRAPVDCPGGAAFGRVTLDEILVFGASPVDVCARIERQLPALAACAEHTRLGGPVTLRVALTADGDVAMHSGMGFDADVAGCMANVVAGLALPMFDPPGLVTLEVYAARRRGVTVVPAGPDDGVCRAPAVWVIYAQ